MSAFADALAGIDAAWLVRLPDGTVLEYDADRAFSSASMVKTFLLLAAWPDRAGTRATVGPEHLAPGDGVLKHLTLPLELPLADLLALMVVVSDNTATNAVSSALGGAARCTERFRALGFTQTALHKGVGEPGSRLGTTTAREHDEAIGRLVADPAARALLEAQQDDRGLARGLAVPFAHKTGTVDGVRHDGGVARHRGQELAITVLTDGGPDDEWVDHPALVAMGRAARAVATDVWGPEAGR